jgi:uncharacterized damage-inducible protein DinB
MRNRRQALLQPRFARVRRDLDQIVDRLTPDLLDWAPLEGMRTISGQIVEILEIEIPMVPRLQDGRRLSEDEINQSVGDPASLDSLKRRLKEVRQQTLNYLDSLSESDLEEEVSYGGRWFGSFWLPVLPRGEVFLNVVEHEFYHIGQLTSYLWARGDNPYNW